MTAGQARLWTGIGCVGSLVVLAAALLAVDAPRLLLPAVSNGPLRDYLSIFTFVILAATAILPFDLIGGLLIPAAFERQPLNPLSWLRQWSRSVIIQLAFFSMTLFLYLQIGREFGPLWLIVMFTVLQIMLVAGQQLIWQIMTATKRETGNNETTQFVRHSDPRFAGGITGLPGFETILIPAHWQTHLQPSWLCMLVKRRQAAVHSGGRLRGIFAAMLWNVFSFTAAIVANGPTMNSVAELVTVFLWFLLFSFVGLLVLPAFNRRSVFALDRHFAGELNSADFEEAIRQVDQLTECEPSRTASVESVFQPIPCPERRSQALLKAGPAAVHAWNIARTALFLSWAFGGPLARAVHCNVGRPELWAMMPVD